MDRRGAMAAGATVVDARSPTAGRWDADEYRVLLYEFGMDRCLAEAARACIAPSPDRFNKARSEMRFFGREIFQAGADEGPLTEPACVAARDQKSASPGRPEASTPH